MGKDTAAATFSDDPRLYDAGGGVWFGVGYDAERQGWRVQRYTWNLGTINSLSELPAEPYRGGRVPVTPYWFSTAAYRTAQEARERARAIRDKWRETYT
jgi:hypothetical protein